MLLIFTSEDLGAKKQTVTTKATVCFLIIEEF